MCAANQIDDLKIVCYNWIVNHTSETIKQVLPQPVMDNCFCYKDQSSFITENVFGDEVEYFW